MAQPSPQGSLVCAADWEEPQFAGTVDCCGAVVDSEFDEDPADMRVDSVQRDGQLACDLRPGQVRRKVPQYPEFARTEFAYQRCGALSGGRRRAVQDVEDVGEQRDVGCLMP